jgi:hypothetical protein
MSYIGKTPASAALTSSDITDGIITLPKLTDGTDGNIISYDASGNPVAVATGTDGQVLTSTGAGSPPAFEALPTNTPAFSATLASNQALDNSETPTKIPFTIGSPTGSSDFDTASAFASNKFTVPAGEAGKYVFSLGADIESGSNGVVNIAVAYIYRNNAEVAQNRVDFRNNSGRGAGIMVTKILDLEVGDYVEGFAANSAASGSANVISSSGRRTWFSGYKIIE